MKSCNPENCKHAKFNGEDFVCLQCEGIENELRGEDFKVGDEVVERYGNGIWFVQSVVQQLVSVVPNKSPRYKNNKKVFYAWELLHYRRSQIVENI